MAENWINTVPQGQTGTGNAQVFGVNPLANQFAGQLGALRQQQQREAQTMAKAWRDNQLAASSGRLWANDMAGLEKDFINRGISLQQKGVNPYGSSQEALDYQRDKRYVEAQQGYRKAVESRLNDALAKISTNPGKYDPKSVQALNDFFAKTKLKDAFESNTDIPQLTERFDDSEILKGLDARTTKTDVVKNGMRTVDTSLDMPGTENVVLGAYLANPRGREQLLEVTGGLMPQDVKEFAPTYADNLKQVKEYIDGSRLERDKLATQGILPGTPQMEEYVSDQAAQRAGIRKRFDNWLQPRVSQLASGVNTARQETPFKNPNEMTEYQRQSLALRQQSENRQAAKKDPKVEETPLTQRQQWIQDIKNKVPASGERLAAYIKGNPEFDPDGKLAIGFDPTNKNIVQFDVPAKVTYTTDDKGNAIVDEIKTPRKKYKINLTDPNFETQINEVLNNVTGQRVDIGSSLGVKGNKNRETISTVKNAASGTYKIKGKNYSNTAISKAAKASGMTVDQYIKEANK